MRPFLALTMALALVLTGLVTAAPAAQAVEVLRLEGPNRFATAAAVDRAVESAGGPVFLVNGVRFPDALSAAPLVAAEGGHLLLTRQDALPAATADRIRELSPTEIVVVGSTAAVSDRVASQAAAAAGAGAATGVERIGGANRVETSLLIFERLLDHGPVDHVWVASGSTFPDALVAASVAGRHGHAVVLDHHGASESAARAWLDRVAPAVEGRHVAIAGGQPSVSAFDARGLASAGAASVERFAGSNRYETARAINAVWAAEGSEPTMLLATGQNFPDALAGAALAAVVGVPLYLSPSECNATVASMLWHEADRRGIDTVIGLGSAASIRTRTLQLGNCATSVQQEIGMMFGRFPTQTFSGTGRQVIELEASIPAARLRATFAGGSGISEVVGLDMYRVAVAYPLHTTHRVYDAESIMVSREPWGVRYLEVRSSGRWTLTLNDLASAPVLSSSARGQRDAVYLYDGPPRSVDVTSTGPHRFSVEVLDDSGTQRIASTLDGALSAVASLPEGPIVVGVHAQNGWTLTVRR